MLTTGRGTHYCKHCGFDMKAKEVRECVACDGDLCESKKRGRPLAGRPVEKAKTK